MIAILLAAAAVTLIVLVILVVRFRHRSHESMLSRRSGLGLAEDEELEDVTLSEPLLTRAVVPALSAIGRMLSRLVPSSHVRRARELIELSGGSSRLGGEVIVMFQFVCALVAGGIVIAGALADGMPLRVALLIGALGMVGAFALPITRLKRRGVARQRHLDSELPDAIDLVTVSVEAGLTLEAALHKFVDAVDNDLSTQFKKALAHHALGSSLGESIREMSDRLELPSLQTFARVLAQSERLGTTLGQTLRTYSEGLRRSRRLLAQERAQKAPIKMLIPMVGCIFPSIFAVLLGPAAVGLAIGSK